MMENSRANALKNIFQLRKEVEAVEVEQRIKAVMDTAGRPQETKKPKNTSPNDKMSININAVNDLQTWLEQHPMYMSDVAQCYPELLSFLLCHLQDGGLPVVALAAQLMYLGATFDEKTVTTKMNLILDMILSGKETCITELCHILAPLLGRNDVGSEAGTCTQREAVARRIVEEPAFWSLLVEEWNEPPQDGFVELVSLFFQALSVLVNLGHFTGVIMETLGEHVLHLGEKIMTMKRPFVASEQKSIQALLMLIVTVFLYAGYGRSGEGDGSAVETKRNLQRQKFVSLIQQIITSAGSSLLPTGESSVVALTRNMLMELATPSPSPGKTLVVERIVEVRTACEVLEHHLLVGAKKPSAGDIMHRLQLAIFPEDSKDSSGSSRDTSMANTAFIVSLFPTLLPSLKSVLDRAIQQEDVDLVEQVTDLLIRIVASSAFYAEAGNEEGKAEHIPNDLTIALPTALNPLQVFFFILGGVHTVEVLLNGALPMKKVACQLLRVLFEDDKRVVTGTKKEESEVVVNRGTPSSWIAGCQKMILSSRCLVTLEAYLHMIGEAENTADYINEDMCRSVLQATMEFLSMLKHGETVRLSPDTISQIATMISQSLHYPSFLRQCFEVLAVMAEVHPYAASMVLDFEFIAEQFSIPDTPTDCNAHIIIGSLRIMQAMVRTAPVVVTFEWVEILAKGVELLPFYEQFPDYAPALWYCILPVMHVAEDALEYFFSPETVGHIASAIATTNDTALLVTMIQVATFLTPRDRMITKVIHDLAMRRIKPNPREAVPAATDVLSAAASTPLGGPVEVSAALVDAVAHYFTAVDEDFKRAGEEEYDEETEEKKEKEKEEKVDDVGAIVMPSSEGIPPPTELLLELWDAMTIAEGHTIANSIWIHADLLQVVSQCLAAHTPSTLLVLLDVILESVAATPKLDRERNAAMRKSFVAATFLTCVLAHHPATRPNADIFHRTMNVMEALAGHVEPSLSYLILTSLLPAMVSLLSPPDVLYDGYQKEVRRLLHTNLLSALVRDVKKEMNRKWENGATSGLKSSRDPARPPVSTAQETATMEMIMQVAEMAVVNAQYSSAELVECTELLSFVDEHIFQSPPSPSTTPLGYGLLHLLLNYDDIRSYWCQSSAADRYIAALEQLRDFTGGADLAMSMYLEEALHGGSK